ncbi:MAG: hypothetical protein KH275_12470 [Clostridiales bacterium]|nr:hypothetical protein [Clostridiales bacterium]
MKLDEINSLVDAQDYEGALQIADTIDWRRVKSIRTLCMVADIYEVNGKLESSMKMLQLAYKRSSVGKMILYRLVELCLKMGRSDDAVSYYNEYLETASNDTSKYILKYKILKAQNAPLDDQIQVLEEYREREYTERWVYELAKLYKRAGKEHKCVETCDDLILWFGEGKYVTKAMELKMTYTPLTVSQREKYEKAVPSPGTGQPFSEKKTEPASVKIPLTSEHAGNAASLAMHTAAAAAEDVSRQDKAGETMEAKAEPSEKGSADADIRMETHTSADDSRPVPQVDTGKIRENSVQLQERLAKSFQEVLSGINRSRAVASMENLGKAAGTEPLKMPEEENISDYQVKDLKPERSGEDKISGEKGEAIAHRTERPAAPAKVKTEKPEDKEITSVKDVDLEALFAETSSMIAETIGAAQLEAGSETEKAAVLEENTEAEETPAVQAESVQTEAPADEEESTETEETAVPEESAETEETEVPEESAEVEETEVPEESAEVEETEVLEESADAENAVEDVVADEEEIPQNPEDFSDIEAALAQAAQGFMEETEQEAEPSAAETVEVSGEADAADLDAERAMEAFAASLDSLSDGETDKAAEQAEEGSVSETEELPVSEEEAPEETTESADDAEEAAMAAFEAALNLDTDLSYEETSEEEDNLDAEEEREIADEESLEDEESGGDPFLSAVSGNTGELDIEAQLRAVLGGQEEKKGGEIQEDDLARTLFGSEETENGQEETDSLEEELSQEEILEEVPAEEDSSQEEEAGEAEYEEVLTDLPEEEDISAESAETPAEQEDSSGDEEMDFTPDIDLDIVLEANKEKEEEQEQLNIDMLLEEAEVDPEMPATIPEGETPEEKRIRIMNATRPDRLTDQQKKLFSYFAKIPGMDQQILDALNGAYSHSGERTSHRGNIAIMGSHGTGKSRLGDGLVKALCKELGLPAAKYARLDASDMNSKDPARVVAKLSGGFLLIERAGHMSADTISKLSKAMDFRTDSLIVIIEDDKTSMRRMLAEYPEFAEKFATVISIPVFTNDELVSFARTYARENGYRMDEMGVLALYTLIGNNQREDEPITVGKVKEMVDGAIRRAGGGLKLGRKISKRHTDEEGRIYLYEKDFDL